MLTSILNRLDSFLQHCYSLTSLLTLCRPHKVSNEVSQKTHRGGLWLGGPVHTEANPGLRYSV